RATRVAHGAPSRFRLIASRHISEQRQLPRRFLLCRVLLALKRAFRLLIGRELRPPRNARLALLNVLRLALQPDHFIPARQCCANDLRTDARERDQESARFAASWRQDEAG